jgi:predicted AAA+ superfamily ATPase
MISRLLLNQIEKRLTDKKAIILIGPRQAGKTTLLETLTENKKNVLWWNGDDADIRTRLQKPTTRMLKTMIGANKYLIIDEAQRIENIGLTIKLITDNIKTVKVIATGSSAFELANKINEPLTGRKWEYILYPISFQEMAETSSLLDEERLLEHRLIYGYYPDVINNPGDETGILKQLSNSYLYKDILTWERIQKPDRLEKLVQALAFQIGNLVSYHELGQMSGLDNETVEHYINLLEKSFVIFRLNSFSRNLRNELKKSRKIYFYDNGLRNSVINQFNPINLRNDKGALWENFLVSERMKFCAYNNIHVNCFFWRSHSQSEIDYVEDQNGKLAAYEFKWSTKSKSKFPDLFLKTYHPESSIVITTNNYLEFVAGVKS